MEKAEGLAEYTGVFVAMRATGEDIGRLARRVEAFEDSDAFARSFGYATGPALGFLLDRYAVGWRQRAASTSLDSMLASALRVETPADIPSEAQRRAALYGYSARDLDSGETCWLEVIRVDPESGARLPGAALLRKPREYRDREALARAFIRARRRFAGGQ